MSDQPVNQTPPPSGSQPQPWDSHTEREQLREMRREERRERREKYGGSAPWIVGLIFIVIGIVLLAQNFGYQVTYLQNWWALFILIPAVGALTTAWNMYRIDGRLTAASRGSLIGGIILLMVTITFLFGLNWALIWPLLLILGGAGLLLNALLPG